MGYIHAFLWGAALVWGCWTPEPTLSFKEMNKVSLPPSREEDDREANLQADKDAFIPLQALGTLP